MYTILLVKANGDIQEKNVKSIDENEMYKLCNYKTAQHFKHLHSYRGKQKDELFSVYGKVNGRANSENKYDFPPPIDSDLFFGILCIVKKKDDMFESTSVNEWNDLYEHLFGGFEDLDKEEERSEDSEIYSDDDYTKEGYLKDNFVVDDDDDELSEEEYVEED